MNPIIEKILSKSFSGRWFATVALVSTYCLSFIGVIVLVGMKILSPDFLMGYLTGLGTLVLKIVSDYFEREDRNGTSGKP